MEPDQNEKVQKFYSEEITLILLILVTNLDDYTHDDLLGFVEAIEGRVDILFQRSYVSKIFRCLNVDQNILKNFERLRNLTVSIINSDWKENLLSNSEKMTKIKSLASCLLESLKIDYVEPVKYMESHFNIDW